MLESVKNSKKPLPEQVSEQIIKLIADRQLKAGDKLPNEFEMAEQLSVGRGTIREAVKILVSRNVVEIKRGCGTFICTHPGMIDDPLGFAFVKDKIKLALDLFEVRMMIEPELAAMAAQKASSEEIEQLQKVADEVAELCRNHLPHLEKDKEFHELIARFSKNSVMPKLVPVIQTGVAVFIEFTDFDLILDTIQKHQMIVDAIRNHDTQSAKAAMIEHLENNRKNIQKISGQ